MATLALNPNTGVVHTWGCTRGPKRKGSSPSAYVSLPVEVLPSIKDMCLCGFCLYQQMLHGKVA